MQNLSLGGNRTLRINCSGNAFADLSTAVLEFTLTNNSTTHALQPLSANGGCFFSELQFLLGGIEAERIGAGGGGLPAAKRVEDAGIAFGIKAARNADVLALVNGGVLDSNSIPMADVAAPAQNSKKVFHRPLLGIANQHLYLPIWSLTGNGVSFE